MGRAEVFNVAKSGFRPATGALVAPPKGLPPNVKHGVGVRGMSEFEARRICIPPHFIQRFQERTKSKADPVVVGQALIWAISNHRRDLYEFIGRSKILHRRHYRVNTSDGHSFVAVVDTNSMVPITVLPENDEFTR